MTKAWKKAVIFALIILTILTGVHLISIPKTTVFASVGPWIGKEENISAYGREGMLFQSREAGWANAYTGESYNMNEGITIRFRVNSIPGVQGEVDAWFAFLLQSGVETTPLGISEGFKFLFREADPKTAEGMAVERMIAIPNGTGPIRKTPLLSPVPMLGNEHYISIVQRRNGNGFLVSIDGVVTDYYADEDAFMIDDLTQAHVIVVANTPTDFKAPWEVEIEKIKPLTATEAWEAFGSVALSQTEEGLSVVESTAKSGSNSALFYKKSVSVDKVCELSLTIDACPSYVDEFSDAYIAVVLSKEEYATNINATDALIAVFKLKDGNSLLGNFGQGSMAAGFDKDVEGITPRDTIKISFGFGEDGAAVIAVNGEIVGISKNIRQNNFLDKKGYLSIVTYNDSASKSNWAYTVSAIEEKDSITPAIPQKDDSSSKGKTGGIVLLCVGGVLAVAAIGVFVFTFISKKKENVE